MTVPMPNKKLTFDLRANMVTKENLQDLEILLKGRKNSQTVQKSESKTIGHRLKVWLQQKKLEVVRCKQDRVESLRSKPARSSAIKVSDTEDILKRAQKELEFAKVHPDSEIVLKSACSTNVPFTSTAKDKARMPSEAGSKLLKKDSKPSRKLKKAGISSGSKLICRLRKSALGREVKPGR